MTMTLRATTWTERITTERTMKRPTIERIELKKRKTTYETKDMAHCNALTTLHTVNRIDYPARLITNLYAASAPVLLTFNN